MALLLFSGVLLFPIVGRKDWFLVRSMSFQLDSEASDLMTESLKSSLKVGLDEFIGKPIWEVPIRNIKNLVASQSWIENARIQRQLPNRILISITPKVTEALFIDSKGRMFPIFEDASLGKQVELNLAPDVLPVKGYSVWQNEMTRKTLVEMIKKLPKDGHIISQNIREITFHNDIGFSIDLNEPDTRLVVGVNDFSTKFQRLENVLSYIESRELQGRVIDATFSKKVLVRLRKAP